MTREWHMRIRVGFMLGRQVSLYRTLKIEQGFLRMPRAIVETTNVRVKEITLGDSEGQVSSQCGSGMTIEQMQKNTNHPLLSLPLDGIHLSNHIGCYSCGVRQKRAAVGLDPVLR